MPKGLEVLLTKLGFKNYFSKASNNNQSMLTGLLLALRNNLDEILRAELLRNGVNTERLTNLLSYADTLNLAKGAFKLIRNEVGQNLGYSPASGVKTLTVDHLAFKDLNRNEKLDNYEDWRLLVDERAADLASKLTGEQIAGLML